MPSLDQFDNSCEVFAQWAKQEHFSANHRQATALLDKAVDIHIIRLYRELDMSHQLKEAPTAQRLALALGFSDSAHIALDAMLGRLATRHTFITRSYVDGQAHYAAHAEPDDEGNTLPKIQAKMGAMGKDYLATLEFLDFGRTHFYRSMHDDHEFMDRVLTGQEKQFAETWYRATNTDPLQDVHGIMGAKAVELLFKQGKILEVGGGTGNGLRNNLNALQSANTLSNLDSYIFTDVSMPFILNTKKELAALYPNTRCEWRLLNINKDFLKQRLEPNSVDMIYGVNAAHIAKHTVQFMQQCITLLKPGGTVVFSERVRQTADEMAPRELTLNQSVYHRTAAIRHREYRPAHAYLTRQHWMRACELAGFSHYEVWPGEESLRDYFPEQYAAVIVARIE